DLAAGDHSDMRSTMTISSSHRHLRENRWKNRVLQSFRSRFTKRELLTLRNEQNLLSIHLYRDSWFTIAGR
ncbi:MAG: hypothetical protein KY432_08130, partial [Acidobacteria bacterium]|nr:hypothetical protein [Acidobacteriota bacterium]